MKLKRRIQKIVYASQWQYDFAPKLGLGKYLVIEIPEPITQAEPLMKAIEEMKHALKFYTEGKDFEALNSIRNAIMNHLLNKFEEENGKRKRYLDINIKQAIQDKIPEKNKELYERVIKATEMMIRHLLQECISNFIHIETGKRLQYPLRSNVEFIYLITLAAIKQLSELMT